MKRVFSNIDQSRVGLYQSILEESGIRTLVKNGNAPYKEVWPELWVVDDVDYDSAMNVFNELDTSLSEKVESWVCSECGKKVDEGFGECWNCGAHKTE